jgi:hypothetical protein
VSGLETGVFSCTATWGAKQFTFTLHSGSAQERAQMQVTQVFKDTAQRVRDYLQDTGVTEARRKELVKIFLEASQEIEKTEIAIETQNEHVDRQPGGARADNPFSRMLAGDRAAEAAAGGNA